MTSEVKATVKNCRECLHHDCESIRALLVPIEAMGPMDLLHCYVICKYCIEEEFNIVKLKG